MYSQPFLSVRSVFFQVTPSHCEVGAGSVAGPTRRAAFSRLLGAPREKVAYTRSNAVWSAGRRETYNEERG